jgi:hypothetical protein
MTDYLEDAEGKRYTLEDIKALQRSHDSIAEALRLEFNERNQRAAFEALKLAVVNSRADQDALTLAASYRDFLLEKRTSDPK